MKKLLATLNLLVFVLSAVLLFLANSEVILYPIELVRESRPIFFSPSGIATNITWLLVYGALAIYAIYQAQPLHNKTLEKAHWFFFFACIGLSTWFVLFIYGAIWLSNLAMIMALTAFINLYHRLEIGRQESTKLRFWAVNVPISLTMAWLTILTIRNIAFSLHDMGYRESFMGIGAELWAVFLLIFVALLGLGLLFGRNDSPFALMLAWLALNIFLRPFDTNVFAALQNLNIELVNISALTVFVLLLAATLGKALWKFRHSQAAPILVSG